MAEFTRSEHSSLVFIGTFLLVTGKPQISGLSQVDASRLSCEVQERHPCAAGTPLCLGSAMRGEWREL